MKLKIAMFLMLLLLAAQVKALTTNGTEKNFDFAVTSGDNNNLESTNFRNYVVVGDVTGTTNASIFKTYIGFIRTAHYLNGESCSINLECVGGFCCDSVCGSSECPKPVLTPSPPGSPGTLRIFVERKKDFSLEPSSIEARLELGETKEETLKIKNTGNTALNISLSINDIQEHLSLSANILYLKANEEAAVKLNFTAKQLGSFVGHLTATGDGIEKSVPISLEVISKVNIFDLKLDIPSAYEKVKAGEELKLKINLFNLGKLKNIKVTLTYLIKDLDGNVIYEESETLTIDEQLSFEKSLMLPKDLKSGAYIAVVNIYYADSFAASSEFFEVVEEVKLKEKAKKPFLYSALIILILSSLIALMYFAPRYKVMHAKNLYINFKNLLVEISAEIKSENYYDAVGHYDKLSLIYNKLMQCPIRREIKILLYKEIRNVYDKLYEIKNERQKI